MKLYRKYLSVLVKSAMQYKASFFMTVLGQLLLSGTAVLAVYFLMSRFRAVVFPPWMSAQKSQNMPFAHILAAMLIVIVRPTMKGLQRGS